MQRKSQTVLTIESKLIELGKELRKKLEGNNVMMSRIRLKPRDESDESKTSVTVLADIEYYRRFFTFTLKRKNESSEMQAFVNNKDIFYGQTIRMNLLFMAHKENIDKLASGIFNTIIDIISNSPTPSERELEHGDTVPEMRHREEGLPPVRGRSSFPRKQHEESSARGGTPDTKQFLLVLLRLLDIVANSEEGKRLFAEQAELFEDIKELIGRKLT